MRFATAQLIALFILSLIGSGVVVYLDRQRTTRIDNPFQNGIFSNEIVDKINPNTADSRTLVALPGLGERRSRDIVRFREAFSDVSPIVFHQIKDLQRVRGVGPALIKQIAPYLNLPDQTSDQSVGSIRIDQDVSIDTNP